MVIVAGPLLTPPHLTKFSPDNTIASLGELKNEGKELYIAPSGHFWLKKKGNLWQSFTIARQLTIKTTCCSFWQILGKKEQVQN
jgi:hypothetical protein